MIEVRILLHTGNMPTSPNRKMHYMKRYLIDRRLKKDIEMAFLEAENGLEARKMLQTGYGSLNIEICFVRPRMMDNDNLIASMKATIDAIASVIIPGMASGLADSDKRLHWQISQRKGKTREYALEIKISQQLPKDAQPTIPYNFGNEFGNSESQLLKKLWPEFFEHEK